MFKKWCSQFNYATHTIWRVFVCKYIFGSNCNVLSSTHIYTKSAETYHINCYQLGQNKDILKCLF